MFGCWDVSTHLSTGGDLSLGFVPQQRGAPTLQYLHTLVFGIGHISEWNTLLLIPFLMLCQ